MTGAGRSPDRPGPPARDDRVVPADAEQLLSQALRARVGGPRAPGARTSAARDTPGRSTPLTPVQILLIGALIGMVVGVAAGLLTLVVG
ncbi:hypothetical protein [Nakamurella leprariae]|uniref:Uncharacterized protein n=1 Tax=Nakamurella leprariae TaxID=2803911 RepID=A0A938YGN6_9ACTN|nr:hypothetical protein [Nakamurella leprariae]MBM9469564.1 hypothetical protein [Nakamurella leprariae]